MNSTSEQFRGHFQSQLDLLLRVGRTCIDCCEKVAELNASTIQQLISVRTAESASQGNVAENFATSGKIAAAHWTSAYSCGLEFQRQLLASLTRK